MTNGTQTVCVSALMSIFEKLHWKFLEVTLVVNWSCTNNIEFKLSTTLKSFMLLFRSTRCRTTSVVGKKLIMTSFQISGPKHTVLDCSGPL